jgi:predicted phosphodiesterase
VLAVLYDIHGNLVALDAVLEDAETAGADAYLLGGDFASWSPWPRETLDRLRGLPHTTWIRGNGERWLREPPLDRPEVLETLREMDSGVGTDEGWLFSLQTQCELDGVLYVHGSPLSDVESFAAESGEDDERLLHDVRDTTVVFGHSHLQFRRAGPNGTTRIHPGSAGLMPCGMTTASSSSAESNTTWSVPRRRGGASAASSPPLPRSGFAAGPTRVAATSVTSTRVAWPGCARPGTVR